MNLWNMRAREMAAKIQAKELSALSVTEEVLSRLTKIEPLIHCFITVTPDSAVQTASEIEERLTHGQNPSPLAGVPIAIKDNLATSGLPTTAASRILGQFRPPYDATVVQKVKFAGMPIVGKTNMDEFAMGSSTESSAYGPTKNPRNLSVVPGGSSGGSAAAVAAGQVPWALGSDTGGSVRQPAAFCGVVGLKPTYGRISRFGLIAYASSLDQVGVLTQDVSDAAHLLSVIAGSDPLDASSVSIDVPNYVANLDVGVAGKRFGVPKEYLAQGVHPDVRQAVANAVAKLEAAGAIGEECSLASTDYALDAYYLLAPAEASSNLARFDGIRYGAPVPGDDLLEYYANTRGQGFGPEVKRRIMLGTYALSAGYYDAYYLKAQKVRTLVKRDFDAAFAKYDFLVTPTAPSPAFALDSLIHDPLSMYLMDVCTIPVNLAGLPAISIPAGETAGLPIGVQIIGKAFGEKELLQAAFALEQQLDMPFKPASVGGDML